MPVSGQAAHPEGGSQTVRPGDVIRLKVWREPDYSGEFPVHADGTVVLPRVGDYSVAGETAATLRERLTRAYSAFLRQPTIDLVVLRRVRVLGAVTRPDLYNVDPTMSLADVVARAGGATPEGRLNEIQLIRNGERVNLRLDGTATLDEAAVRSGDTILVPQRPWIARNAGVLVGAASTMVTLIVAFIAN